jgi:hypothetical protein
MKRWQFSLSSLGVATTLICVGLALVSIALSFPKPHPHPIPEPGAFLSGVMAILVFGAAPGWLIGFGFGGTRRAIAGACLSGLAALLASFGLLVIWDF